jgi:CoA:oxalate CoA-transferase
VLLSGWFTLPVMDAPQHRPLQDLTVLDLTTALAGPFATLLLAGLGARVIKIENPQAGDTCRDNAPYLGREGATLTRRHKDDVSVSEVNRLRGKLGVTLNLKSPAGREIFGELLRRADIVVENFTVGALDRIGCGYDFARGVNPRIVFCSITGFGQGDTSGKKAMDTMIQALSGIMYTSGTPADPPMRLGVPIADLTAPLFAVIGVLAAVHQARQTGIGQQVDISMLGALTALVAAEPFDVLEQCGVPYRTGRTMPRLTPFGVYPARDGYVAICAFTDAFAANLLQAIGRGELLSDPRFGTRDGRVENVAAVEALVEGFTRSLTTKELMARLDAAGVPAAEVRGPREAARDPRVTDRGDTVPLLHPKYGPVADVQGSGLPIRFSGAWAGFDRAAPALGEHNDAVYGEMLGFPAEKLARLRAEGAI